MDQYAAAFDVTQSELIRMAIDMFIEALDTSFLKSIKEDE